ncbi:MAG: carboxypeptidase-like regulatory domain-containing protein [Gammaproteobacteria bacterium]|nr:carboxypeptidase-like regulatory domain-containing protein [Gammaproteobacteria bacterium]
MTVRDGLTAAGIRVVAESDTMPRPRTTVTDANGRYSLAQLLPGSYRVTFEASNGAKHTLTATVLLDQATVLSLELDTASDAIEELVVGKRVAHRGQASIANAISGEALGSVPLGPDYRDLVRLAPGVQVTQDRVRGPSAGGSGQDNVYRFDGVDVSLPMFGTLSAEPSSHDIDQLTFARGGAKAVGFNRSGGFSMDSTAKSGSDTFHAGIEYAMEPRGLAADRRGVTGLVHSTGHRPAAHCLERGRSDPALAAVLLCLVLRASRRPDQQRHGVRPGQGLRQRTSRILRPADLRAHGYGIAERRLPHIQP